MIPPRNQPAKWEKMKRSNRNRTKDFTCRDHKSMRTNRVAKSSYTPFKGCLLDCTTFSARLTAIHPCMPRTFGDPRLTSYRCMLRRSALRARGVTLSVEGYVLWAARTGPARSSTLCAGRAIDGPEMSTFCTTRATEPTQVRAKRAPVSWICELCPPQGTVAWSCAPLSCGTVTAPMTRCEDGPAFFAAGATGAVEGSACARVSEVRGVFACRAIPVHGARETQPTSLRQRRIGEKKATRKAERDKRARTREVLSSYAGRHHVSMMIRTYCMARDHPSAMRHVRKVSVTDRSDALARLRSRTKGALRRPSLDLGWKTSPVS